MSVLCIADSNELDQRIIKLHLLKNPVFRHVLHLYNGPQLLNYLKENRNDYSNLPDALLLDLNIQPANPWNVMDTLTMLYPSFCKPMDIYVMSASILPKDINKALSYDFVKDFIAKPVTRDILIEISRGNRQYVYR